MSKSGGAMRKGLRGSSIVWCVLSCVAPWLAGCGGGGDELQADGPDAATGDAGNASRMDASSSDHTGPDCDMAGLWIARQQTVNVALGLPQTANNWYYLELAQEGEQITVVDHFDCGAEVLGTAHVQISRAATQALTAHNHRKGQKGTLENGPGDSCELDLERFWSVRGASESEYAPEPRNSEESLAAVQKRVPLPTPDEMSGAEDWDGDGKPGLGWHVMGIVTGVRNSVQRDWTHWFSDRDFPVTAAQDFKKDLVLRVEFDAQEIVIDPASGTLASPSKIDNTVKHRVTLRFLGRDASDARAKALLKAAHVDTCYAIQKALPAAEL